MFVPPKTLQVIRSHGQALSALLVAWPSLVSAHPGRTNAQGCHNNRGTGEYYCHGGYDTGGGGGGTGGGPTTPPALVCRDVQVDVASVSLQRLHGAGESVIWKQQDGISVSVGKAMLGGQPGKLYRYTVEDLEIRDFVTEQFFSSSFSFAGATWIPARDVRREGDTTISILESNLLNVTSEHYRVTTETRQECS